VDENEEADIFGEACVDENALDFLFEPCGATRLNFHSMLSVGFCMPVLLEFLVSAILSNRH
jgi:hypothetical protein